MLNYNIREMKKHIKAFICAKRLARQARKVGAMSFSKDLEAYSAYEMSLARIYKAKK